MNDGNLWLLHIAVGPVGAFITGGRRSRDLWYGSRLLSELTVQAALFLQQNPRVELWLPSGARLDALRRKYNAAWSALGGDSDPRGDDAWTAYQGPTVTNKVYAAVNDKSDDDIAGLARKTEEKVRGFLAQQARHLETNKRWKGLLDRGRVEAQMQAIGQGDFVEFYAVWVPLVLGHEGSESLALARVDQLMTTRKNTRAFAPAAWSHDGHWKSSLDRGWDAVTTEVAEPRNVLAKEQLVQRRAQAGIGEDERLGLVDALRREAVFRYWDKRSSAESEGDENISLPRLPFPPLARVTADPWLGGAQAAYPEELDGVHRELAALHKRNGQALSLISSPCRVPGRSFDAPDPLFPFDPTVFFDGSIAALRKDLRARLGDVRRAGAPQREESPRVLVALETALETLKAIERPVLALVESLGFPIPYYAMVEADGDNVGHLLFSATSADRAKLRDSLHQFSDQAWEKIDGTLEGCAFYVGGDEMVFYCAADRALDAVTALRELFESTVGSVQVYGERATLSFGVVIAHMKQDLREVRNTAHTALGRAKAERRRRGAVSMLGIGEIPRAGAPRFALDATTELTQRLLTWLDYLRSDRLSLSTAEDLMVLFERYGALDGAAGLDLARALPIQKCVRSGRAVAPEVAKRAKELARWSEVPELAAEIRVAERLNRIGAQRMSGVAVQEQEVGHG